MPKVQMPYEDWAFDSVMDALAEADRMEHLNAAYGRRGTWQEARQEAVDFYRRRGHREDRAQALADDTMREWN